jgi:hypothetical protein
MHGITTTVFINIMAIIIIIIIIAAIIVAVLRVWKTQRDKK